MGLGSGDFAKLRPDPLTLLGALRGVLRRATWKTFPGMLLPSPGAVVQRVMDDHGLPALAAAIAKGGTIVFNQGFGFTGPHNNEPVTGDSLFRIASNSKAITAAAIHVLAARGGLSLSERVFGGSGILGTLYGSKPYSNWLTQI